MKTYNVYNDSELVLKSITHDELEEVFYTWDENQLKYLNVHKFENGILDRIYTSDDFWILLHPLARGA